MDIEIYTREWCPYCIKAKALLSAKGVAWHEIDISGDPQCQQMMEERSGRKTVPQIFLDGAPIGGYDDLARLNASGELDSRLGLESPDLDGLFDVAIVGGGPAGLTAAMYAGRKNLRTVVVATDIGGQVGTTRDVANYPGCDLIVGPDLAQRLHAQTKLHEVSELIGERVAGLGVDHQVRVLKLESGRDIRAKTLILASGVEKRRLQIPGEKEFAGRGVYYCATCDGPLFNDLDVAVVGGGNSALEAALELAGIARHVRLVALQGLTGDAVLRDKAHASPHIELLSHHTATEIHGSEGVESVTIVDVESGEEQRLSVDGLFVEIGSLPNTGFARDFVEMNEVGEIVVDRRCRTSVAGVFAAGDCTDVHDKQIVVAVAEGAKAALTAFEYLITQP